MSNQGPPEELLNGVRDIAAWNLWLSEETAKQRGEQGLLRTYLGDQLRCVLNEFELDISHKEGRGIFSGKSKLTYTVAYLKTTKFEFTDLLQDGKNERSLESVRIYHSGEWEKKLDVAYQKCLSLSSQWNSVSRLIEQLGSASYTPEEFIDIIEAIGDTKQAIKLLALSSTWESVCTALSIAYTVLGRCKEAEYVLNTLVSIYPENADCHLAFGNLFLGALINANPPPEDSISMLRRTIETTGSVGDELIDSFKRLDPSLFRALTDSDYEQRCNKTQEMFSQVTLNALDCSYDYACKKTEEQFQEALRLSRNVKTTEQTRSAIATLIMTIKMKKK